MKRGTVDEGGFSNRLDVDVTYLMSDVVAPVITGGEVRTVSSTGGEKGVKPERHDLIPVEALAEVARVYGTGAQKYSAHNWRKGYEWSKSYAAAQRHLQAFWSGEDFDPEMGTKHLGNAIFHLMGLMVFMDEHPEFDDRYKPEGA